MSNLINGNGSSHRPSESPFPSQLTPSLLKLITDVPKLTHEQVGHIRHFHNLSSLPSNEWTHMGTQEPGQEFLDSYRYQLANMTYAASLAYYHRLPAARSVFKGLIERLIGRMMLPAVWNYWYLTSQGGVRTNPNTKQLREPWADPVVKENIMYSGHLLLMVSLHAMLFDDDKYDQPGALSFLHNPIFWGMGPQMFSYTRSSLQSAILDEMERTGYLGVCCEPNLVFIVCNQFPLLAMGFNDKRTGTSIFAEILAKYRAAWSKKGMLDTDGYMVDWWMVEQDKTVPHRSLGFTAWAGSVMNAHDSKLVSEQFERVKKGWFTRFSVEGEKERTSLNPPEVAKIIREKIGLGEGQVDDLDQELATEAWTSLRNLPAPKSKMPFIAPDLGYVFNYLTELGSDTLLQGLLNHSDKFHNPTWSNGGLFYPSTDPALMMKQQYDADGKLRSVDAFTGNSAIGYARLNVKDGMKIMFEEPWTSESRGGLPYLDGVDLKDGVDVLRATWVEEERMMVLTFRSYDGRKRRVGLSVRNLPDGEYVCYEGDKLLSVGSGRKFDGEFEVGDQEVDIAIVCPRF